MALTPEQIQSALKTLKPSQITAQTAPVIMPSTTTPTTNIMPKVTQVQPLSPKQNIMSPSLQVQAWVQPEKDYIALATPQEKKALIDMVRAWGDPARARIGLQKTIDRRLEKENTARGQEPKKYVDQNNKPIVPKKNIMDTVKDIWIWIWSTVAWLWASYWVWSALKSIWKTLYGATLPPTQQEAQAIQSYKAWISNIKPVTAIDTALNAPMFQQWPFMRDPSSILWQFGTRSQIWLQSEVAASKIFKETINPLMQKADDIWISISYQDLINKAKEWIASSKKYSVTQIKQILSDIDEIAKNYQWSTTLKNLDLEKQAIVSKIPEKYLTMAKIPQEAKAAQDALSSAFREWVHSTIKDNFGVDSAKLYREYANFKGLSKIWPKALTQAGRKWWFGWAMSWIAEELATPITTTTWKLAYKWWQLAQYLPKKTLEIIKKTPEILRTSKALPIIKGIITDIPAWIIWDKVWAYIKETATDEYKKEDFIKAIENIKAWKKPWIIDSPISRDLVKWLDKESSIILLEKVLSSFDK